MKTKQTKQPMKTEPTEQEKYYAQKNEKIARRKQFWSNFWGNYLPSGLCITFVLALFGLLLFGLVDSCEKAQKSVGRIEDLQKELTRLYNRQQPSCAQCDWLMRAEPWKDYKTIPVPSFPKITTNDWHKPYIMISTNMSWQNYTNVVITNKYNFNFN